MCKIIGILSVTRAALNPAHREKNKKWTSAIPYVFCRCAALFVIQEIFVRDEWQPREMAYFREHFATGVSRLSITHSGRIARYSLEKKAPPSMFAQHQLLAATQSRAGDVSTRDKAIRFATGDYRRLLATFCRRSTELSLSARCVIGSCQRSFSSTKRAAR